MFATCFKRRSASWASALRVSLSLSQATFSLAKSSTSSKFLYTTCVLVTIRKEVCREMLLIKFREIYLALKTKEIHGATSTVHFFDQGLV